MKRNLLWAGVAVPVIYYATLLLAPLTWPEYSHVRNYASELGSASAPYPFLFNVPTMLGGFLAIVGAIAMCLALREITGRNKLAALFGFFMACWGVGMVMGGMFPMPDERHGSYGIILGGYIAPIFLMAAIWKDPQLKHFKLFIAVTFVAMLVMFAIMMGVGQLVRVANVGLWQRFNSLTSIPWIGITAYVLWRRLGRGERSDTEALPIGRQVAEA